jgi:hypothetical protein
LADIVMTGSGRDMIEYEIQDSRGNDWRVKIIGPMHSGSMRPGQDLMDLPQRWGASFRRPGASHTITVELASADVSERVLVDVLEEQPEWEFESWAGAPEPRSDGS